VPEQVPEDDHEQPGLSAHVLEILPATPRVIEYNACVSENGSRLVMPSGVPTVWPLGIVILAFMATFACGRSPMGAASAAGMSTRTTADTATATTKPTEVGSGTGGESGTGPTTETVTNTTTDTTTATTSPADAGSDASRSGEDSRVSPDSAGRDIPVAGEGGDARDGTAATERGSAMPDAPLVKDAASNADGATDAGAAPPPDTGADAATSESSKRGDSEVGPDSAIRDAPVADEAGDLHDDAGTAGDGLSTTPPRSLTQASAGWNHTCGLRDDATVTCWGDNFDGQGEPPADRFVTIDAGNSSTCGVKIDGTLACWGSSLAGLPAGIFASVSVGNTHACAVRSDGNIACWGENTDGESTPP